jgi:predicted PurR-regulated permease PerM
MYPDLYRKAFLILTVVALGFAAYKIFEPFFGALAWAICLAFLLYPAHSRLTGILRGRPGSSAGILVALTPVVLILPLAWLGLVFAEQVAVLVRYLQSQSIAFDASLLVRFERLPVVAPIVAWLQNNAPVTSQQMHDWLVSGAQHVLKRLAATSGTVVLGAADTLLTFVLMLFLLFFLLRDGRALLAHAVDLMPIEEKRRQDLLTLVGDTTRAVVYGSGVTSLLQGVLVGIGFAIAGLPSPVVFAALAAVLALLPAGGAAIVWIPGVLGLALQQRWGWALFLAIWGFGVSTSDNLLRPLLISRNAPVSTLAVFIGVIGGASAFGAIGLIIGPVLLTLIAALLKYASATRDAA